jgi:hypothetical protein
MLVLAAGTKLFRKVDTHQFMEQAHTESGFWLWFSEKTSTHPHLAKRLSRFPEKKTEHRSAAARAQDWSVPKSESAPKKVEQKEESAAADDLSRFMPK